ncbi:methyltransferase, partial [Streptomyces durbertensis]|nr:methyltransferase [Streptomyces durbertensis]
MRQRAEPPEGCATGAAARTGPSAPVRAVRLPGVYRPQSDTMLLAEALDAASVGAGDRVLDMCTGTGVLALRAARLGAEVTAVDISRRAVLCARLNARLAGLPVTVRRGDLLAGLPPGERFDVL